MSNARTKTQLPRKLEAAADVPASDAREQAEAYDSIFAAQPLRLDDGDVVMIPPHPDYAMLDDDRMEAWDELMFEVDTEYDREPDIFIPEQKLETDNGSITLPAETRRGALKRPFRKQNVLVRPSHSVRVVQTVLGDDDYARLRAGGRNASDVYKLWNEQSLRIKERQQRDSKSAGSAVDLAPVPPANS